MATDRIRKVTDSLKDLASIGYRYGEFDSTHNKLNVSIESIGIIKTTLTRKGVLYAIVKRTKNITDYGKEGHDINEYYNCKGELSAHSPFELLIPITNIDLKKDIIDPLTLVGGKVLVTEIDRYAMKAEYIGELTELNESPLRIPRTILKSMRNYVGGFVPLDSSEQVVRERIEGFGYPLETLKKMYKYSVSDWEGKSVRFEKDAVSYRDVKEAVEGEVVVPAEDSIEELLRELDNSDMKTKKCHLPVKIFSAR